MKNLIIAILCFSAITFIGCNYRHNLSQTTDAEFVDSAKMYEAKLDSFHLTGEESIEEIMSKARMLVYYDTVIMIGKSRDSLCQNIATQMIYRLDAVKDTFKYALRINYGIALARYLTKKYGYETFANFGRGYHISTQDASKILHLRSDGFDKQIVSDILKNINAYLYMLGYKKVCFSSKTEYFRGRSSWYNFNECFILNHTD